jgi:hypothetical protein
MLLILPEFQDPNSDHIEIYEYTDEQGNSMLERINFHSIGLASCKIREKYSDVHDNSTGMSIFFWVPAKNRNLYERVSCD